MNGFEAIKKALKGNLEIRVGRGDGVNEDPFVPIDKCLEQYGDNIPMKLLLMDEWQVREQEPKEVSELDMLVSSIFYITTNRGSLKKKALESSVKSLIERYLKFHRGLE